MFASGNGGESGADFGVSKVENGGLTSTMGIKFDIVESGGGNILLSIFCIQVAPVQLERGLALFLVVSVTFVCA